MRHLRTLAHADGLARGLGHASSIVVIGAGWIGSEVAASARQLGCQVAMIDPGAVPLHRVLGAEVGAVYRDLHADHGVELHLGTGVESLHGASRVEEVRLTDGSRLPADLVVVGIGAAPRVELASSAGLAVDDGIVVDALWVPRTSSGWCQTAGSYSSISPPSRSRRASA